MWVNSVGANNAVVSHVESSLFLESGDLALALVEPLLVGCRPRVGKPGRAALGTARLAAREQPRLHLLEHRGVAVVVVRQRLGRLHIAYARQPQLELHALVTRPGLHLLDLAA